MFFQILILYLSIFSLKVVTVFCLSKHPIALIVAFDGFRYNYFEKGVTPVLESLSKKGTSAEYMNNVFITKTYPNFHSISTGVYPEVHGVIANVFFDPDLGVKVDYDENTYNYNPELIPIWTANELAGDERYSGSLEWYGSEFFYKGRNITYNDHSSPSRSWEDKVDTAIRWIEDPDKPANLVLLYIGEPDYTTHNNGPDSVEGTQILMEVDNITKYLVDRLEEHNLTDVVNLFFVADHGMQSVIPGDSIDLTQVINTTLFKCYECSPVLMIYPNDESDVDQIYQEIKAAEEDLGNFKVYLKEDLFDRWYLKNNRRTPAIVAVSELGYYFVGLDHYTDRSDSAVADGDKRYGMHGYDNAEMIMKPFFFAVGPNIKTSHRVEPFYNIDLYPLWCHLLGFPEYADAVNGTFEHVKDILTSSTKTAHFVLPNVGGAVVGVTLVFSVLGLAVIMLHKQLSKNNRLLSRMETDRGESKRRLLDMDEDT